MMIFWLCRFSFFLKSGFALSSQYNGKKCFQFWGVIPTPTEFFWFFLLGVCCNTSLEFLPCLKIVQVQYPPYSPDVKAQDFLIEMFIAKHRIVQVQYPPYSPDVKAQDFLIEMFIAKHRIVQVQYPPYSPDVKAQDFLIEMFIAKHRIVQV